VKKFFRGNPKPITNAINIVAEGVETPIVG
jgi:hypothetical protein